MLEEEPVTRKTQLHFDRCLSCRNCETTCPSGVTYHALLDIGRAELERRIERPLPERLLREGLRRAIPHSVVFGALLTTGRATRPFLPAALGRKIARRSVRPHAGTNPRPAPRHPRTMLMLEGCVQPALSPNTNAAARSAASKLARADSAKNRVSLPLHVAACAEAGRRGRVDPATTRLRSHRRARRPSVLRLGRHVFDYPARACAKVTQRLGKNQLDALESGKPELIVTANIGCQMHLDGAGRTPVRHWIELVEASLP